MRRAYLSTVADALFRDPLQLGVEFLRFANHHLGAGPVNLAGDEDMSRRLLFVVRDVAQTPSFEVRKRDCDRRRRTDPKADLTRNGDQE